MTPEITSIDDYIAQFPAQVQEMLVQLRTLIHELAPEATEKISYQIPTFFLNGNLVHFAAYAHHIGFYPTSSGITHFEDELADYKHAKGSVQFPLDQPLPVDLIAKIVAFRRDENLAKGKC
jgi:uncharacterized protein YdhG (YjbR/CyaY superfamily)